MRRTIYKFHKWLGLAFGLLLMMQAGSGVVLSFRPQIQGVELQLRAAAGGVVEVNEAIAATRSKFPHLMPERVLVPQHTGGATVVRLEEGRGPRFVAVLAGEQVGLVALPMHSALQWLFEWHEGLWWGGSGRWVLVFQAMLLFGFVGSGLYFWWPLRHKQGLRVKWKAASARRWYDLHRVVGVCVSPLLMLTLVTGGTMVGRALAASGPAMPRPAVAEGNEGAPIRIDTEFVCGSCGQLKEIRLSPDGGYRLIYISQNSPWPLASDSVRIAPNGEALVSLAEGASGSQRLLGWMYPLHSGKAIGWFGQFIIFVVGVSLLLLPVFATLLWVRRLKKKKRVAHGA